MQTYIIRRLVLIIPTLFLVTLIVFFSVRFVPGSIIDVMMLQLRSMTLSSEEISQNTLRASLGMDVPIPVQYGRWMSGVVRGDFGKSLWTHKSISTSLAEKLPISIELGIIAIITGLIVALPIGIFSAIRQDTALDYVGRTIAILFISVPGFWIGTMVMVYPAIWWGWTPPMQYIPFGQNLGGNLLQFVVPGFIMGMAMSGGTMRMTRTMMLEVLRQDYIRTAWSKGLAERTVIFRHALKNALIPVVTIVGMQMPVLIGGTVILEQIFNLPGIGRFLVEAITSRDYPVVSGVNIVLATFILFINLIVDITYAYLDPRIHYT
ncbi:MAG: ABC transporter permease [Chloroflexi bacterium]|nr:ABC transporter permease [Chloroflexota bacterium]